MFTVFLHTLRESLGRRMGLVMAATAVLIPGFMIYSMQFDSGPAGVVISVGREKVPAELFTKLNWNIQLSFAQNLWTFIGIFAAAPLLSSFLEKGWADLLLTKGVARWQFLVARMAACVFLFAAMLFMIAAVPALYVSMRTGISARPMLLALGMTIFSFLCLVTLMALVSVAQPNVTLLVIVGFVHITLATALVNRKEIVKFFNRPWLEPPLDLMYTILPRTKELGNIAGDLLNRQAPASWAPFWWSVALAVSFSVLACYVLNRKAM